MDLRPPNTFFLFSLSYKREGRALPSYLVNRLKCQPTTIQNGAGRGLNMVVKQKKNFYDCVRMFERHTSHSP